MNTSLTENDLVYNNFGAEGVKAIGEAFNSLQFTVEWNWCRRGKGNRRGIESEYLVDSDKFI